MAIKGYDPKQYDPAKILNAISGLKGKGVIATEYADNVGQEYFPKIVSSVWLEYENVLAKEKSLDLDDLLLVTMQLLKKNQKVREYYQNLWKYIHIDEYQDTNTVQYQIARLLTDSHKNICVVGDADQNIYSWRGADISNILRFEKDFPNSKVVLLEENYRSTKTIIDTANQIIKKNKQRIEKNLLLKRVLATKLGFLKDGVNFKKPTSSPTKHERLSKKELVLTKLPFCTERTFNLEHLKKRLWVWESHTQ